MAGLVKSARLENCRDFPLNEWKRIVAELEDGSTYSTGCMEPEAARRNYMVIALYTRRWGKLINQGSE